MTAASPREAAARAFVDAVAWGEHTTVWEMLAPDARLAVLEVATRRGMDVALAARLREGTAGGAEHDEFLRDLLQGLRAELLGIDHESVRFVEAGDGTTIARSSVVDLVLDLPVELGAPVPVARVEVVADGGRWLVVRIDAVR